MHRAHASNPEARVRNQKGNSAMWGIFWVLANAVSASSVGDFGCFVRTVVPERERKDLRHSTGVIYG